MKKHKNIIEKLNMNSRDEVIIFLKKLLCEQKVLCPICQKEELDYFHKKAKKSSTEYKCNNCKNVYKVVDILQKLD